MRILLLTSDFLPNVGGMATHAHELAKAFVRNGHMVHLVHPIYGSESDRIEMLDGITVHKLFIGNQTPRIKHIVYIRKVRKYILDLTKSMKFEVLHWHDLTPNCWTTYTLKNRIPLVWTNHSSNYLELFETAQGKRRIRNFLHHPGAIISPSRELHEKSSATGVPPDRLYYIPNGVDAEKFKPSNTFDVLDKDYAIDAALPVIICPRRLEPKNGVEYFIRSIPIVRATHPDVQFLIVGGGFPEERERFEVFLREVKQRHGVFFTGNVANTLMPQFYALATIAALPSLMEATSIAGLEAMASGLPLVGTKIGGIPEIIEDGVSGILVDPRSPEQLAKAFIRLLENRALRTSIGAGARTRVEKVFSWDNIASQTVQVYNQVISDRKH